LPGERNVCDQQITQGFLRLSVVGEWVKCIPRIALGSSRADGEEDASMEARREGLIDGSDQGESEGAIL